MNYDLTIAQAAKKHGINPLKKYGQNFIFDSNLCEKIVKVSKVREKSNILEIGPGTAGLTRAILATNPLSFTVIENDKRCIPLLRELHNNYKILHIIEGDALDFDLSIFNNKINIIANLPYNIGTELLVRWLRQSELIESITIMLQKEVTDRIRAEVGNKNYGRLTVLCNILCYVEKCFDVKNTAFYPRPKVDSAVVRLVPRDKKFSDKIIDNLELITKYAFGQRRKMLKSSLKKLNIEALLSKLNINSNIRAENVTIDQYLLLAMNYNIL